MTFDRYATTKSILTQFRSGANLRVYLDKVPLQTAYFLHRIDNIGEIASYQRSDGSPDKQRLPWMKADATFKELLWKSVRGVYILHVSTRVPLHQALYLVTCFR